MVYHPVTIFSIQVLDPGDGNLDRWYFEKHTQIREMAQG
jgi:hypothetical protein